MNEVEHFFAGVEENIDGLRQDAGLAALSQQWLCDVTPHRYPYNFTWLGRPIIQLPQDILAIQELIWRIQPARIIETGIAHGGSLILSASCLELLGGNGRVLGIDIEIRSHNRQQIETHPMFKRIDLLEGPSTAAEVIEQVQRVARGQSPIMVILDSDHTHQHVAEELRLYSRLVTKGSYLVVFDTLIDDLPESLFGNRPWGTGNNPKTAVAEFLAENDRFVVDTDMDAKLLLSAAPGGYLRCVKD